MIQNIEKGKSFTGLAKYLLGKKDAARLGGTLHAETISDLSREVGAIRKLNKDAEKVIVHTSLSLPPGETLTDEQWLEVAEKYVERMGYGRCAWMAVRHHDTEHDHIHIGIVRIDMADGKAVKDSWDYKRGEAIVRELEKEYGLKPVQEVAVSRRMNRNEVNAMVRTGEPSHRQRIAEAIDAALETPCTLPKFIDRLAAAGVGVQVNMASTGRISGISFNLDGHVFKGSKIGKSYTWGRLKKRGVSYEQDRDRAQVEQRQNQRDAQAGKERHRSPGSDQRGSRDHSRGHGADTQERQVNNKSPATRAERHSGQNNAFSRSDRETGRQSKRDRAPEPQHQSNTARNLRRDADKWSDAVAGVAAVAGADAVAGNASVQRSAQVSAATAAKIGAWRRQHEALQAPHYRITLTSRRDNLKTFNFGKGRGENGGEKFYTADEVERLIPYLSARNIKGYDIYITPIDPAHHYMVLDDSTDAKIRAARQKYGEPCLIQESSAGNRQAIFKVRRDASFAKEQQIANKIVQRMNQEYGDPAFSGVIHPFRMAGFSNKKSGKGNAFTKIVEAWHTVSDKLSDMLSKMRHDYMTERQQRQRERTIQQIRNVGAAVVGDDAWSREKRRQAALAERLVAEGKYPDFDPSAVDYRAARSLLDAGHRIEDVKDMMAQDAELTQRHPYIGDYIDRTVARAEADRQAERSHSHSMRI